MAAAFAAAVSRHPVSALATGEAVGEILEALAAPPDLALVAVRAGHRGALEDITATVAAILAPGTVVGFACDLAGTGPGALGPGPALAVWAGATGPVTARPDRTGRGVILAGAGGSVPDPADGGVVAGRYPDPPDGGVVAGRAGRPDPDPPDGGDTLHLPADGPVWMDRQAWPGVRLDLVGRWRLVVLPATRDIGPPLVVTSAAGMAVHSLDGVAAIDRITDLARQHLPAAQLATAGPRLGLRAGSGLPWALAGFEPPTGAVVGADGPAPEPGTPVRLCVPDPDGPGAELLEVTDDLHGVVGQGGGGAIAVLPPAPAARSGGVRRDAWPALPMLVVRAARAPSDGADRLERDVPPASAALFPFTV